MLSKLFFLLSLVISASLISAKAYASKLESTGFSSFSTPQNIVKNMNIDDSLNDYKEAFDNKDGPMKREVLKKLGEKMSSLNPNQRDDLARRFTRKISMDRKEIVWSYNIVYILAKMSRPTVEIKKLKSVVRGILRFSEEGTLVKNYFKWMHVIVADNLLIPVTFKNI